MVYHIGFILEQSLGHITHSQNLQANVTYDREVQAHWACIPFHTSGVASRLPIYKNNWTLRAGLRARQRLSELSRHTSLDVLFFHTQVPGVLAQSWMKKVPSVVSLDATPIQYDLLGEFYHHRAGPAWLENLKWQLNRNCYAAARHLVAWSEWTKESLVADYHVPADKITVVPPGVNVSEWRRPTPRQPHDGPVRILFVGGDLERKGGRLLLDAFRALRPLELELHLVTRDHVRDESGVFVYNDIEPNSQRLKDLYHRCDIFALPTFGDCLPMVLSEAGAAEMAIISTDVAAIPEIVRHGQTGLTIPTGDTSALADAIGLLATNRELRTDLAARALTLITKEYDAKTNADRLLGLLKHEAAIAVHRTEAVA